MPHEPESAGAYVPARNIVLGALQAFLPPERVTVAAWAAANRWVANEGGGYVGKWDPAIAPYLTEPMEQLTSATVTTTAIVGPGQCGKTEVANNWMLHSIDTDPASMLRYMQTDDAVRAYVKDKITPLIEGHDAIRAKQGLKPIDDSIGFKRFQGMTVQFLAAARSNLINKSAPRLVADEYDAYDPSFGDPKTQLDVRRQTFGQDSMLLAISHPDRARSAAPEGWTAGIMAIYAGSTACTWWAPCPHCAAWSSPNPGTARHYTVDYPADAPLEDIAAATRLVCPVNGCLITEAERIPAMRRGRWIGAGETIEPDGTRTGTRHERDTAGYWIVGVMSPFLLHGMGGLATARVKAERARGDGDDDTTLREVMTKQWGIPYDPPRRVGNLDAAAIADRAEPGLTLGAVPAGVRFLTAAIDVQAARFEWLVRGWGVAGESWVIERGARPADTATSPGDWDDMLAHLLDRAWPLDDGSGRTMRLHALGYDSGGAAGVTLQAYDAHRRARTRTIGRKAAMLGQVDGRNAWTVLPLKGMSLASAPRLAVVYPDSGRKDRFAAARGQVPLGQFNPNQFKDDLANQLARADAGAWSVHIPAALRDPAGPPHPFFDQLVAERRLKTGVWERTAPRNEVLDLMVMTHVMAHLHGLPRLRWDAPRAWHAPWDGNSNVLPAPDVITPRRADPGPAAQPQTVQPAAVTPVPPKRSLASMLAGMNG